MPDNLPDAATLPRELPGHRVLALSGRDAAAFAQAQFMGDVARLADGHWHWNGWLTPKGRVIALFALLRLDAEHVWLLLPDADPADLAAQLRRFVFRSKVVLEPRPDLRVAGAFQPPARARAGALAGSTDTGFELDMTGDGGPRVLHVGLAFDATADDTFNARWTCADLAHGLPRLDASQSGEWTPQMLSLQRLHAFSVKKGCYPGQEIVARTHFLGRQKRELVLLAGDTPFAVGKDAIVSEASTGDRHVALAVRPLEREADPRERPLLDGLSR
ncbi:MAG TPA: folate-binding protein [Xanthomonadaceae bacterium]|nr:folate-binding protein [Xanthomonadaceae bacterium]